MKGLFHAAYDYLNYALQGTVIFLTLGLFGYLPEWWLPSQVPLDSLSAVQAHNLDGVRTLLLVVSAFVLGHANSSVAYFVLQEGFTSWRLGRPSYQLLGGIKDERRGWSVIVGWLIDKPIDALIWVLRRLWIPGRYYHPLPRAHRAEIVDFAEDHPRFHAGDGDENPSRRPLDRRIFSVCFAAAQSDEAFRDQHERLLSAYNFSRNMASALFISSLFILGHAVCPHIKAEWALPAVVRPEEAWSYFWMVFAVASLLFVRYLYMMRAYTRQVLLRALGRRPAAGDGAGPGQAAAPVRDAT